MERFQVQSFNGFLEFAICAAKDENVVGVLAAGRCHSRFIQVWHLVPRLILDAIALHCSVIAVDYETFNSTADHQDVLEFVKYANGGKLIVIHSMRKLRSIEYIIPDQV